MTGVRVRTGVWYLALAVVLVLIIAGVLPRFLPHGLATSIGHNSEALFFAFGFCAIAQFLYPWMRRLRWRRWLIAAPIAAACFLVAWLLLQSDLPSSIVTLNEPIVALGLVLLYVSLPRPLKYGPFLSVPVLLVIVLGFNTGFVLSQAESLVTVLLAPLSLDYFHRTILEQDRRDEPAKRLIWVAVLLALAVAFILAYGAIGPDPAGPLELGVDYAQRAAEAYWGWLIVHVGLGYWIGIGRVSTQKAAPSFAGKPG